MMTQIPTYAINIPKRLDRRNSIMDQFSGREEFDLTLVSAVEHPVGAVGLWQTIIGIVRKARDEGQKHILICEDDHIFTNAYNARTMYCLLEQARQKKLDVLLGGVCWYDTALQIGEKIFWLDIYNGGQFTLIFDTLYDDILEADFGVKDNADIKLAKLSRRLAVSFPFISIQRDFGYSDIYFKKRHEGQISYMFKSSEATLRQLATVGAYYNLKYKQEIY